MILFCDTSALVKLYANETHSGWMRAQAQAARQCIVSQIAWAEMCAALARKARLQQIEVDAVNLALARLQAEWPGYLRLAVDGALIRRAGELALALGLRAYDAVQLASAHRAYESAGGSLHFCCFDQQLVDAALALGLPTAIPRETDRRG